nr:phosphodiester glycosidase family protein [Oscillospiraceae bacterium]
MKRKLLALILALALLPAPAALAASEPLDGWSFRLCPGVTVRRTVWWTGSDLCTENYLTLAPGAALRPVAVSGESLCSVSSMAEAAARLEAQGLHVAAGVNGGYYNTDSLTPVGLVVSDGHLRSSAAEDAWMSALGFRADGSAILGRPAETLYLVMDSVWVRVSTLNRERGAGLAMFTEDFSPEGRTAGTGFGWNLICAADKPVPISGDVTLTVERLTEASGPVSVPAGRVVLSLAGKAEDGPPDWMSALTPGARLRLRVRCASGWEAVESALALLYPLLENGKICSGLSATAQPRTAVGLKADGTLLLYTVDGRQSGYSVGLGLNALAARMQELGCVQAATLDGGGSTNLEAVFPGDSGLSQINRPSTGKPRKVTSYVLLTTTAQPSGVATRLGVYPLTLNALAGTSIPLTVLAADENGYGAPLPEELTYTVPAGLGTVEDGALRCVGTGRGTLSVNAPGLEAAELPLTVTETPDAMAVYGEAYGKLTRSLTLSPGQEVDLTVYASYRHMPLRCADTCFTWTLDPAAGTVDATGHIVPAQVTGEGTLTVRAGQRSVSLPIRVWTGVPFRDVAATDAYFQAVRYCYEKQLLRGVTEDRFDPEGVMNRAMLVTVLWRIQGGPEAETEAAFRDVLPEDWFAEAAAWAAETGLAQGYDKADFAPMDSLTRQQVWTLLYRSAGEPE